MGSNIVAGDSHEVLGEVLEYLHPLLAAGTQYEFLAEVVRVGVSQELPEVLVDLIDDDLNDVHGGLLDKVLHLQRALVGLHVLDDLALEGVVRQVLLPASAL